MIIDFHTHAFANNIAAKAIPKLALLSHITPYTDGTLSDVLSSMQRANIDYSVVANIATNPKQMKAVNDWAIAYDKLPFIQFGSIHPDSPDWESELERLKSHDIKGIKLHPDYQGFFVDDKNMIPIYRKIAELDMALLFHSGYDIGLMDPVHCTPQRFANVIDQVDTSKFVLAHMGGYKEWEDLIALIAGQPFYIDTAFSLCDRMSITDIKQIINSHGIDKVLFGTDSPWADQKSYVDYINQHFTNTEKEQIFYNNSAKLLHLN